MLIIAVLFILVVIALFGAVAFSKWRHTKKEVDIFECGLPKIDVDDEKTIPSIKSIVSFLVLEAVCLLVLLASQIDFESFVDKFTYLSIVSVSFCAWAYYYYSRLG